MLSVTPISDNSGSPFSNDTNAGAGGYPNYAPVIGGSGATRPAPLNLPQPTAASNTAAAMAAGQSAYSQLPNYNGDLASIGSNISAETSGQLPSDVITQLQQGAAESGVSNGTSGSDTSNAAYLRALGLTSLNLTNQGQQNFQSILPTLPGAGVSQAGYNYVSPAQNYETELQNDLFASGPNPGSATASSLAAAKAGIGAAGGGGTSFGPLPPTPSTDSGMTNPTGPTGTNPATTTFGDAPGATYDPNLFSSLFSTDTNSGENSTQDFLNSLNNSYNPGPPSTGWGGDANSGE